MTKRWVIGAQLSTSHSSASALTRTRAAAALETARAALDLDILIVGADEVPEVFREMTEPARRQVGDVYLWYNLLSDIAGMEPSDLVVDWRGRPSRGWGGWAETGSDVRETFRFVCPNNPDARRKTLSRLAELLGRYPFDGVFLDKIRFPSPANGLDEVVSCFCDHCGRAAASRGLDLAAVASVFERADFAAQIRPEASPDPASSWLDTLLAPGSLLARFVRFRCDSVTGIIAAAHDIATAQGRKVALDLFSPGLAAIVGQDYRALRPYAAWAKPMTYRVALGPASLRLEIPSLADGLSRLLGLPEQALADWASRHVQGFGSTTLENTRHSAVPLSVMREEIAAAIRLMDPVPVYFGLELVRQPGVIDITPALVTDMVGAGLAASAAGAILSWDLMHAPDDGLRALASAL